MGESLEVVFSIEPDDLKNMFDKCYFVLQYCLFMYCSEDLGRIIFKGLQEKERQTFENIYQQYQHKYKISEFSDDKYFKAGCELLNALYHELCNNYLQCFDRFGSL